jgi:hypothetical protein
MEREQSEEVNFGQRNGMNYGKLLPENTKKRCLN